MQLVSRDREFRCLFGRTQQAFGAIWEKCVWQSRGNLSLAVSPFRIPSLLSLSLSLFGSGTKKGNDPLLAAGAMAGLTTLGGKPNQRRSLFSIGMWEFPIRS